MRRHLIDQAKPRSDVGDIARTREFLDGGDDLLWRLETFQVDFEAGKFHHLFREFELVPIEYYSVVGT